MKRTLLIAIVAFAVGYGIENRSLENPPAIFPAAASPAVRAALSTTDAGRLPDVAERTVKSVVNISSIKVIREQGIEMSPFANDPFFRQFFGDEFFRPFAVPRERRERSLGSGVIVGANGYILTNNHVVANADVVSVVLSGTSKEIRAKIVGADPKTDVALVKIESPDTLTPIPMGDSDKLRLGEMVLAIGCPFGLGGTVTMGIVSATGRANVGISDYEDFIQTDASINPGNSGGALVNLRGELVGINTAIYSPSGGSNGIGFAVPIKMARHVMEELIAHGKIERGWLGIAFQDITPEIAKALGLDESVTGAVVTNVIEGSPAGRLGIIPGNIVTAFSGKEIADAAHLRNALAETRIGQAVDLVVRRSSTETQRLRVTIEKQPERRTRTPIRR